MIEWPEILLDCSKNVQENVSHLLKRPQHQTNYGIGAGGDTTYQIDRVAEEVIISTIVNRNIDFILISEEAGIKKIGRNPQHYVTMDPIDGTTNALRGMPFVATSIAVSRKPQLQDVRYALVTDLSHDVTYTAQEGQGAYKNDKKVAPSEKTALENLVLGIEFTSETSGHVKAMTKLLRNTKHPRHLGADALEICYVADGTIDGFVDVRGKLRVTDMAAAQLILKEAGGIITTLANKRLNVPLAPTQRVSFMAIANKTLHKEIKALLNKGVTKDLC
jgi:myo-inositol-1(or 4)-monophosphatase